MESFTENEQMQKGEAARPFLMPMPLLNTPFTLGHCMKTIGAIENQDLRTMAYAEYYYFNGHPEKASDIAEPYLSHEDISLSLSACWIFAYANLALDRIEKAKRALGVVKEATAKAYDKTAAPEVRAWATFVATSAAVLLHLPVPEGLPALRPLIPKLGPGLRLFALYVQAHQKYLEREYGACVGIVETALSLQTEIYPIPSIYLHLVATMGYMSLKKPAQAKEHLLAAWELSHPDDLIEALGEHHGLLGGMLEAVIKKEYPEDFKRIIAITYSFSAGWRKVHNPATGHNVADDLTTTEFAVAMLAARGWLNKEIAVHMGITENTVKHYISSVLQKLNISQRKELPKFMLI